MSLRVRTPTGTDRWASVHDERHWYDYTHAVDDGELLVYLHTFRRVRMPAAQGQDFLLWKHHTSKLARSYAPGEWVKVTRAKRETPPAKRETVPRLPREPRRSSRT
ncbi:MAG: hypothetical protein ACJ716_09455 [Marmoricola sp.]